MADYIIRNKSEGVIRAEIIYSFVHSRFTFESEWLITGESHEFNIAAEVTRFRLNLYYLFGAYGWVQFEQLDQDNLSDQIIVVYGEQCHPSIKVNLCEVDRITPDEMTIFYELSNKISPFVKMWVHYKVNGKQVTRHSGNIELNEAERVFIPDEAGSIEIEIKVLGLNGKWKVIFVDTMAAASNHSYQVIRDRQKNLFVIQDHLSL